MPDDASKKIGEYFLESGAIDEFQLKSALGYQGRWGKKLGQCLVELGFISESKLARALSKIHRLPTIDLDRTAIHAKILRLLPRKLVTKYAVLPVLVQKSGNKKMLFLATADPSDIRALDEIRFVTGFSLSFLIATYSALERSIRRYYLGETVNLSEGASPPQLVPSQKARQGQAGQGEFDEASIRITPLSEEATKEKEASPPPPPPNEASPRQCLKKKSRYQTDSFRVAGEERKAVAPVAAAPDEDTPWESKTKAVPAEVLPEEPPEAEISGTIHKPEEYLSSRPTAKTPQEELQEGLENDSITGIFRGKVEEDVFAVIQNTFVDVPATPKGAKAEPGVRRQLEGLFSRLHEKKIISDEEKQRLEKAAARAADTTLPQILKRLQEKLRQKQWLTEEELESLQPPSKPN